jgi:hypothetical protein
VHAAASEQDGAIFLTAAFTGLRRGELLALRWRDIDFEGEAIRVEGSVDRGVSGTTKSDKGRNVPMVEPVAQALARLRPASALHSSRGSRLSKRSGRAPRRFGSTQALPRDSSESAATADQIPRLATHVRLARDQSRLDRAGAGVDGSRGHRHDEALPASQEQEPKRRREAALHRVCGQGDGQRQLDARLTSPTVRASRGGVGSSRKRRRTFGPLDRRKTTTAPNRLPCDCRDSACVPQRIGAQSNERLHLAQNPVSLGRERPPSSGLARGFPG